ncbi:Gfo/Idh/MocA family oxidoreductase [Labrys sp. ZIDIC5]|uniref:Gfo/Idh/MocA family protein n=1 Tax=Labrys sedimenti TaxID=3106036 RepID=UPI002ACAF711|nr:Gfo/Idh/MocA family oxidoreductase [Labrys sp. ZIDIC5]MDZ5453569.1 Gfo/Idh/MocA family oxidoreductase [Labrys sp. ZIDIC5]
MAKTRWGILSTAKIGTGKVIPGIQRAKGAEAVAIASRDLGRAEAVAKELGIPKAYGSYEALLADPDIDAIYNPLPNHLHVPLTLQAVAAGKHVLCEKPIGLTAQDAAQLLVLPRDRLVMEAFMVRFHPQWLRAREAARSGELGEVRAVQAFFSYYNVDPANVRNQLDIGGGGILDIGCYPIVAGRFIFEAEPRRVIALVDRDPATGVDRLASAILDFGEGRRTEFTVSTQLTPLQRVDIVGTKKRFEIAIPFNAPQAEAVTVYTDDGSRLGDASALAETIAPVDQYAEEVDAFSAAIRGEITLPYGPADAVQNMKIIDALFRSEKSGAWETV